MPSHDPSRIWSRPWRICRRWWPPPSRAAEQVSAYQRFTGNRLALNAVTGGEDAEMRRFGDLHSAQEFVSPGGNADEVRVAHERFTNSGSDGQRRMAALTDGRLVDARRLEVHPGLWAGPSLLRDGAGTVAVGSYQTVANVLGESVCHRLTPHDQLGTPVIRRVNNTPVARNSATNTASAVSVTAAVG